MASYRIGKTKEGCHGYVVAAFVLHIFFLMREKGEGAARSLARSLAAPAKKGSDCMPFARGREKTELGWNAAIHCITLKRNACAHLWPMRH